MSNSDSNLIYPANPNFHDILEELCFRFWGNNTLRRNSWVINPENRLLEAIAPNKENLDQFLEENQLWYGQT